MADCRELDQRPHGLPGAAPQMDSAQYFSIEDGDTDGRGDGTITSAIESTERQMSDRDMIYAHQESVQVPIAGTGQTSPVPYAAWPAAVSYTHLTLPTIYSV